MKFLSSSLLFAAVLAMPFAAVASKEGILPLSEFRLSSSGIGQSGEVIVSGKQRGDEFISFTVQAFGRTMHLSKEQLAQVRGGSVNGLQISYAAGYAELGGRAVYVVLSKGFTSGVRQSQMILATEQGAVEVKSVVNN